MLCKHLSPVISFGACFLSCYWESGRSHRSREAAEKEEVGLRYSRPGLVVSTHSLAFAVYREKVCLAKDEDGERTWSGSRDGSLKPERMNRQGRLRAELLQANDTLGAHQGILLRQRGSREFCCIHFLFFFFFTVTPAAASGSSPARDQIEAAAAALRHSHGNTEFEPHLWPALHLAAPLDP